MSVLTAMTAQNTIGVTAVQSSTPEFLAQQLDAVFTDIPPDAVKIGMVFSPNLAHVIGEKLRRYNARNVVLDPVMVASSGAKLLQPQAVDTLKKELFPLARVITPNLPEAEALLSQGIPDKTAMEAAAKQLSDTFGCAVLLKGGHRQNDADDVLYDQGKFHWFYGEHISTQNTHGTGCTLSSAIAVGLADGCDVPTAVQRAKDYVSGALKANLRLGHGCGPIDHGKKQRERIFYYSAAPEISPRSRLPAIIVDIRIRIRFPGGGL